MSESVPLAAFPSPGTANSFLNESGGENGFQRNAFHTRTTSNDAERNDYTAPLGWRGDLYLLLEQPTSSTGAFIVHFFFTALIVVSALVTVLETVPSLHSTSPRVWFGLETMFVLLFTVEYAGRAACRSNDWKRLFHWAICKQFGRLDFCSRLLTS
jgi:hypothetical protein